MSEPIPIEWLLTMCPEEHLRPIGLVVSQFAWTDLMWSQAIWKMLGLTSKNGRQITTPMSSAAKLQTIERLGATRRRLKKDLPHLIGEGDELRRLRNLVAHGVFFTPWLGSPIAHLVSYSARQKLKDKSAIIPPGRLEQLARRIATYNQFLHGFHQLLPRQRGGGVKYYKKGKTPRTLEELLKLLPPELEV